MSARLPTHAMRLSALVLMASAACDGQSELTTSNDGPCGRGMARSCQCDDGSNGISQCKRGSDWGECICNPQTSELEPQDAAVEPPRDAGRPRIPRANDPGLAGCESTFNFRAHAAGDLEIPYRVAPRSLLPGSERQRACFYFRVPYAANAVALGFSALLNDTLGLRGWRLYGLDSSAHDDGEVSACNGVEPAAYLLAAFAPGVADVRLPDDVGLALPHGPRAGIVLEVEYENDGTLAQLDRSGIRVCTARSSSRAHTAAVHVAGSEGICIPAGAREFEVHGECTPRTNMGTIHLLDVWPAMRQGGRRMAITIVRANGTREVFHDQPFSFEAQTRFPTRDVQLLPGDKLDTRCYYDNDSARSIAFGASDTEETCYGFITAWPAGALSYDPFGALGALGVSPSPSCLDPTGILASCNGAADRL